MLANESEQTYAVAAEFSHFDTAGYLTPAGYQHMANSIADRHLVQHGLDFDTLFQKGISWVLLSLTLEIRNPVQNRGENLIGRTWYSGRKGIYFRREISVQKVDGTPVFDCTLYSTLLDLTTRSIYRKRELPFDLIAPTEKVLLEAKPTFKEKVAFTQGELRVVRRSYLDRLGHVNNGRYGDFCLDSFCDTEANLENMCRMELYFVSELSLFDTFWVNRAAEGRRSFVQGCHEKEDKPSFYGVFSYKEER